MRSSGTTRRKCAAPPRWRRSLPHPMPVSGRDRASRRRPEWTSEMDQWGSLGVRGCPDQSKSQENQALGKDIGWRTWTPNNHRGFPRNADASERPDESEWTSDLAHATQKTTRCENRGGLLSEAPAPRRYCRANRRGEQASGEVREFEKAS
jgi:hypothetical protein